MRASLELARCEVESAGLSVPAECSALPPPHGPDEGETDTSFSSSKEQIRHCVECVFF